MHESFSQQKMALIANNPQIDSSREIILVKEDGYVKKNWWKHENWQLTKE